MSEARHGELNLKVIADSESGSAENGKLFAEAARVLANRLTTLIMQNGGKYAVEFDVKILEITE